MSSSIMNSFYVVILFFIGANAEPSVKLVNQTHCYNFCVGDYNYDSSTYLVDHDVCLCLDYAETEDIDGIKTPVANKYCVTNNCSSYCKTDYDGFACSADGADSYCMCADDAEYVEFAEYDCDYDAAPDSIPKLNYNKVCDALCSSYRYDKSTYLDQFDFCLCLDFIQYKVVNKTVVAVPDVFCVDDTCKDACSMQDYHEYYCPELNGETYCMCGDDADYLH